MRCALYLATRSRGRNRLPRYYVLCIMHNVPLYNLRLSVTSSIIIRVSSPLYLFSRLLGYNSERMIRVTIRVTWDFCTRDDSKSGRVISFMIERFLSLDDREQLPLEGCKVVTARLTRTSGSICSESEGKIELIVYSWNCQRTWKRR